MKKKLLLIPLVLLLAISLVAIGCPAPEEEVLPPPEEEVLPPEEEEGPPLPPDYETRTEILIGAARPVSGPGKDIGDYAFGPMMDMWVAEVNAAGGLYLADYDKSFPLRYIIYDDTSDVGTSTRLIEKLILEDEVDILFPNCGTAFLYASAPLANKYGYVYLGAEGGCTTLTAMLPDLPYVFGVLNYSDYNQVPVLADIFVDEGVETVAIIYINDLHGVEYYHTALSEFELRGIEVVMGEAVPLYATDVELVLKQAEASGADAFCAFVYPPTAWVVVQQAMALGYNPNAMVIGPGVNFQFFLDMLGEDVCEGLMGFGAWNRESSDALNDLADLVVEYKGELGLAVFGDEEAFVDWWGQCFYWAALQCLEGAIIEAGNLDQATIRDILATSHFETVLGDTWFDMTAGGAGGGLLALECAPGQVGQWQSGIYEVIDPGENRTTDAIIYPKLPWPTE